MRDARLDWPALRDWRDRMRRHLDDSAQVAALEERGATFVRGSARLDGPGRVVVDGRELRAEHVVLATGSVPVVPEVDGLDALPVWTNREATGFAEVPERVAIIGGSAVAVEVSQYLHGLGSRVTIVGRDDRLLAREDPQVGAAVEEHLRSRGIELRLGTSAVGAARTESGGVLRLDDGSTVETDVVVLATGRRPRSDDLGLETVDAVQVARSGAVQVDATCHAGDNVWAIGDVTDVSAFTHVAKYQARVATDNILGRQREASYAAVPRVVFGRPEVAAVGWTTAQARQAGVDVRVAEVDLTSALARPWTFEQEPSGRLGLVADGGRGVLVGAWAVAPEAGEWIHQAALAVRAEIPIDVLADQVVQFPTFSEGYLAALDELRR